MAQINQIQRREEEDPLTTLMKGLSIARDIYGIKTNIAQMDEFQRKSQADQDLAAGKYNKNQQLSLSEKFDISPNQPQGAYQQGTDLSSGSPLYMSLKRDSSPMIEKISGMKNGTAGTLVVDVKNNKELGFYPSKPDASAKDKSPIKIETIDENGNPITKLVANEAGQTFAASPKIESKLLKPQYDAATFGRRAEAANAVLGELNQEGYDRTSYIEAGKAFILPDASKSSQLKRLEQAERNFVNAVLRPESGATITKDEFENARMQYFPRAGDTPEVLAQKAQNRQQAIDGLKATAGKAWDEVPLVARTAPKKDTSGQAFADPGLEPGHEDSGYIFQGGDPANKANWKKK